MPFRAPEGSGRFSLPFHVQPADQPWMMSDEEISIAREKGRLGAEEIYRQDPEKRAQAEAIFGVEYMRYTYPRAYANTKRSFLDRMLYWGQ